MYGLLHVRFIAASLCAIWVGDIGVAQASHNVPFWVNAAAFECTFHDMSPGDILGDETPSRERRGRSVIFTALAFKERAALAITDRNSVRVGMQVGVDDITFYEAENSDWDPATYEGQAGLEEAKIQVVTVTKVVSSRIGPALHVASRSKQIPTAEGSGIVRIFGWCKIAKRK